MKTKDNAQKIVSAKIVAKLVKIANEYVVPCINIEKPGRYSASQLAERKDAFGNKIYFSYDRWEFEKIMPIDKRFSVVISASGMRPIVILNHSRPFQDGRWNDIPVEELQK